VPCPDGSAVVYEVYDTEKQDYDLWLVAVDGGSPRRLVERARNPAWSPDGGRLAFSMRRRGSLDLWLLNRDGEELMRVLDTPDNEYLPVWSPSGGALAFVREIREANRTRYELIVRAADGSETTVHSRLGQAITSLCWAPGSALLFTSRTEINTRSLFRSAHQSERDGDGRFRRRCGGLLDRDPRGHSVPRTPQRSEPDRVFRVRPGAAAVRPPRQ